MIRNLFRVGCGVATATMMIRSRDAFAESVVKAHSEVQWDYPPYVGTLRKKMGVTKPVMALSSERFGSEGASIAAFGHNFFSTPALIMMNSSVRQTGLEWLTAHELSHIASNDLVWVPIFMGMTGTITAIALRNLQAKTRLAKMGLGLLKTAMIGTATAATMIMCSQLIEKRADLQGFAACSPQGKKEGILERPADKEFSIQRAGPCRPQRIATGQTGSKNPNFTKRRCSRRSCTS